MSKVKTQPPSSSSVSKPRYGIRQNAGSMVNSSDGARNHTPYTQNCLTMQGMHPHKLLTTVCSRNAASKPERLRRKVRVCKWWDFSRVSIIVSQFPCFAKYSALQLAKFKGFKFCLHSFNLFPSVSTCFKVFQLSTVFSNFVPLSGSMESCSTPSGIPRTGTS